MYIALEGIKGAGKSTALTALIGLLQQEGVEFETFNPTRAMPANTWWEQAYQKWSHDDQFLSDLYTARANYHASRTDFSKSLILGDRSIITSLVTRWPKEHTQYEAYVTKVRQQEYAVPLPDAVAYLAVDVEVAKRRIYERKRLYGQQDETLVRLYQAHSAYQEIFAHKSKIGLDHIQYQMINANHSDRKVYQDLLTYVKNVSI